MRKLLGGTLLAVAATACVDGADVPTTETTELLNSNQHLPSGLPLPDSSGQFTTVSTQGSIDLTNEFFQDLGTNGRRCVTCHAPTAGWGVTPEQLQAIFVATNGGVIDDGFGLGAAFRTNDGSVSPNAPTGTYAQRKAAFKMLLTKGLIRVGIGIPATAEFELVGVDDPYGYASAAELSLFRRPLPATNLQFLSTVMWDGRETFAGQSIHFDLSDQANGATQGHAAGDPLSDDQRESIVNFESSLFTAQIKDNAASQLDHDGAHGGAAALVDQDFYIGINDLFGDSQTGDPFSQDVFGLYGAWAHSNKAARRAVARGEQIFNRRQINIRGVSGINDEAAFGNPEVVVGSCSTCHDSPNVGDHSVAAPLDIGLTDASRRTPDMPLYTLRNKTTGQIKTTTDPGRALITGKWKDVGRFKGPILRGLASRAPYFHNGSARDLGAVVDFYNDRFEMHLSAQEKSDLVAFLRTL